MAVDHIRYDLLVRDALRGVVKHVVSDAARNGLPGEHHFFIAFYTGAPGVKISSRLRAQYPEEMTIILQHQFWDLSVSDTGIEVGLSFDGIPEKLVVPFDAMKGFFDPSVQFGLEFEVSDNKPAEQAAELKAEPKETAEGPAPKDDTPAKAPRPARERVKRLRDEHPPAETGSEEPPARPTGGGEVVRLDRFRKK